jgi:hypothetical protein
MTSWDLKESFRFKALYSLQSAQLTQIAQSQIAALTTEESMEQQFRVLREYA